MSMKIEGGKVVIRGPVTAQELAFRMRKFQALFGSMPLIQISGRWEGGAIAVPVPPQEGPKLDVLDLGKPQPVTHVGRMYIRIDMSTLGGGWEHVIPERGTDVVVELYLAQ